MSVKNLKTISLYTLLALCTCSTYYGRSHIYLGASTNFLFPTKKVKAKGYVPSSNNEISKNREGYQSLAKSLPKDVENYLKDTGLNKKRAESHYPALNKATADNDTKKTTEECIVILSEINRNTTSPENFRMPGIPAPADGSTGYEIDGILSGLDPESKPLSPAKEYGPLQTKVLPDGHLLTQGGDGDDHWVGTLRSGNNIMDHMNDSIREIVDKAQKPETKESLRSHLFRLAKSNVDRVKVNGDRLEYSTNPAPERIEVERDFPKLAVNQIAKLESILLFINTLGTDQAALNALGTSLNTLSQNNNDWSSLLCENLDGEYDLENANPMTSFDISGMLLALFDLNDMLSVGVNVSIGYSLREFKLKNTPIKMNESLVGKLAFVLGVTEYLQLHLGVGVTKRLVGLQKYDQWDQDYELVNQMRKNEGIKLFETGELLRSLDPDDTCDHVALFWHVSILAIYPFNENLHGFISAGYQSDFNNFVGDLSGSKLELDGLNHFTFGLGVLFKVQ